MSREDALRGCAISEVTTPGWTFEEDVAEYARAGWGAIGIWLQKLAGGSFDYRSLPEGPIDDRTLDSAAEAISAAGLKVSSLICTGGFTNPERETLRRRLAHGRFAIDAASRLGAPCVLTLPGNLCGRSRTEAMQQCSSALWELAQLAEERGVRLAVEAIHETQTDFIHSYTHAIELVERVDHASCGIFLDTFQLSQAGDPLMEIERCSGRIYGVHVADAPDRRTPPDDRCAPGDGVIPLASFLRAAEAAGFDGWFEVELISQRLTESNPLHVLERCASGMRQLVTGLR